MSRKWKIYKEDTRIRKTLSESLGIDPVIAQILANRGVKTADAARYFLFGDLSSRHDPFLMKDMKRHLFSFFGIWRFPG